MGARPWRTAAVALAIAPAWLALGQPLQDYDTAQYAEVARRILTTGQWGHLEDSAGPFLNKPPLDFWLMAASMRAFGVSSAAARLPTLLLALALAWLTFRLGKALWDARTGTLAAAFVATSVSLELMVADPKVDGVLSACVAAAILCAVEARRRPAWIWAAWACGALGFLAKGPVGFALPALAVAPEALRRPWREEAREGSWLARLAPFRFFSGTLLAAAIVAPWLVAQFGEWGWGGVRHHLWDQGAGRFGAEAVWRNDAGPFFFVHTALWAFLPFSPALAAALVARGAAFVRARELPPDCSRVPLWWLGLSFAVISLSPYKLPQYLFPLAVPGALLAARGLTSLAERDPPSATLRWLSRVGLFFGLSALGFAALVLRLCFPLPALAAAAWLGGLALGLGIAFAFAQLLDGAERAGLLLAAPLVAFAIFYQGYLHPALLRYQPGPRIGELARAEDPDGRVLPFVGAEPTHSAAFYAQRDVREVDQARLRELLASEHLHLAVLSPEALGALSAQGWKVETVELLASFPTSRPTRAFLLASSRPTAVARLAVARVQPPP